MLAKATKLVRKYAKKTLEVLIVVVLLGILVNFVSWKMTERISENKKSEINEIRKKITGVWKIKTQIDDSLNNSYDDLWFFDIVSISVDNELNISGISIRYAEGTDYQNILIYPRDQRRKTLISGSVIEDKILLTGSSTLHEGLESIDFFDGSLRNEVEFSLIEGSYFSDVSYQIGKFCALKIEPQELVSFFDDKIDDSEEILFDCFDGLSTSYNLVK